MNKSLICLLILFGFLMISCGSDDYSPSEDTENPTSPANLTASNIEETTLQLNWTAASDNVGVSHYRIYMDGEMSLDNVSGTSVSISGLTANEAYTFYVTAVDAMENESSPSNTLNVNTILADVSFLPLLSQMGVFTTTMSQLIPVEGVQIYEINSELFTDYAKKQRLVRLPNGQKMRENDSDLLPLFPDNTLIAKTFYYNIDDRDPGLGKKIIETRILLKIEGSWQVGDYIWNSAQTEATYRETGSTEAISYIDIDGNTQNVAYIIPSKQDCFTCHNNSANTFPIGMKLRNMNFIPSYTGQNQLDYFTANGLLEGAVSSEITVLPDWTDGTNSLSDRARAYMEINCAHCHQPGGPVPPVYNLDLRLETPYEDSGISDSRLGILDRFESTEPFYRMPQLGRTVVHDEALLMLTEYIDSLD